MNKKLKIVLIVMAVIFLIFATYILPKIFINLWQKSFIPTTSSNSEVCSKDICKEVNADNFFYNESSAICTCYKQGQVLTQTRIG